MSEQKRSFFSTIPGLVTGLAGLLTAIVGLATVLIQLGVIGGDDSSGTSTDPTTTLAPGAAYAVTPTTEMPRFTVNPATLDFKPADPPEKKVTVRNTSSAATLTVDAPRVVGTDRDRFTARTGTCTGPVRPGTSCELSVTFTASGPLRSYSASLEVTATGARGEEVRLTASTLLG